MTTPEQRPAFTIVDRRGVAIERAAFPRDPSLADPSNGPAGTVGPDSPATTYGAAEGAEPVVIDGDEFDASLPGPRLAPSPWAGWPSQWQPAWNNGGGTVGGLGNKVSTVFSCTALNANALGSMPVSLTEDGRPLDPELYEWTDNPEPRLFSGWEEFLVQAVVSILTRGDLYVAATSWDFETFLPARFMVVDPDKVTCRFSADGSTREYWINGEPVVDPRFDLLHVRYLTAAGWPTGLSPLQGAAGNLRSAGALEQYGAQLAESGGIPWGTLTTDERLTRRQRAIARAEWIEAQANRQGGPAIFGQGIKLNTLTLNPRDMALLDLRVFDEQRIAAAFGVPPFLIGLPQPEGLTYANATSMYDAHWRQMLRPLARKIMGPLSRWALPRGRKVHLNAGDYVQPSLTDRTTAYEAMHAAGALTLDEWRALEGLPPLTTAQRTQRAAAAVANQTPDSSVLQ